MPSPRTLFRMDKQHTQTYSRTPWIHKIEMIALRFWWVILFILLCYMVYERTTKRRADEYAALNLHLTHLHAQRTDALALREKLEREMASKGDPAYIELLLMQELGLVPKGQIKVLFDSTL